MNYFNVSNFEDLNHMSDKSGFLYVAGQQAPIETLDLPLQEAVQEVPHLCPTSRHRLPV